MALKDTVEEEEVCSTLEENFVWCSWPKGMSIWSISCLILVYNMDGSPNEAGQISEVVNIVLHYKTHSERTLLAVSSLRKQSMILSYTWLKDHNLKVNWKTREVQMNQCPSRCEGCQVI